jgi:glutamate racemase
MKHSESPIGIFDSGIGGLTVANAVLNTLPNESFIYFGDTAHLPYGDKSPDTIKRYCSVITGFLLENNVKLIIIACNSASSVAFEHVQEIARKKDVQVINVIDPVVDYIHLHKISNVGVIGTRATIGSNIFPNKIHQLNPHTQVESLATPLLASMIESGFIKGDISKAIIEAYLVEPAIDHIEALILACTHYPLIKKEIAQFYTDHQRQVEILATNEIVALYVKKVLEASDLINKNSKVQHQFFVSDYTDSFEETTKLFYKEEVLLKHSRIFEGEV